MPVDTRNALIADPLALVLAEGNYKVLTERVTVVAFVAPTTARPLWTIGSWMRHVQQVVQKVADGTFDLACPHSFPLCRSAFFWA
jgi:hypothetical protein